MIWIEIAIRTTEEASETVAHFLHEMGAGGVAIEESGAKKRAASLGEWVEYPFNDIPEGEAVLKAYFPEERPIEEVVDRLKTWMGQLAQWGLDAGKGDIQLKRIREEDWANQWKQYYKPLNITERITVKPVWEKYEPSPGEIVVELDPGMAFGTGTHPTTSLCLQVLDRIIRGGEEVIDVGTGSGILAIAACKLGARRVLALDLDPIAVKSAHENVRLNGLQDKIVVRQSDLLAALGNGGDRSSGDIGVTLPVRLVVANILAEVIVRFVDDVYEVLQPGGLYLVSGIYQNRVREVEDALQASRFTVTERFEENGWYALVARKGNG